MSSIIIICIFVLLVAFKIWMSSPKNIGKFGEKRVARKLDWFSKEYIKLNDILLPTHYGTTQIDHIVVSPYGIFVIETKNYKGWIFGHENSEEWKQSLLGKKRFWGWSSEQHKLRNPIRQNAAHARAVKAILKEVGDFPIIPIVVFADSAELNITTPNHIVINWCNLRSAIKSYRTPCISPEDIQRIVSRISSANITTEGSRESHIRNVQTAQQNRDMAIANGKCPKCGGSLVERRGRYGTFLGCSNYPRCRFTHNLWRLAMVMRKEENSIILEPGDLLYRYDLGEKLDAEWLTDYSSPEYSFSEYGLKNKIGLFFFYNDISAAKNTLAQAVYNQKKIGTIYNYGTITSCQVIDDIRLLDLETGLYSCSDKIRFLHQIGLNVITERFYNYQFKRPYSELKDTFEDLLSTNKSLSLAAENAINEFFHNFPPLLGQSLTDFDNGETFKEILENNGFEGYMFMEDFISDTYCLLSSDKITAPEHEIIDINSNKEMQKLIGSIEVNEKLKRQ